LALGGEESEFIA